MAIQKIYLIFPSQICQEHGCLFSRQQHVWQFIKRVFRPVMKQLINDPFKLLSNFINTFVFVTKKLVNRVRIIHIVNRLLNRVFC